MCLLLMKLFLLVSVMGGSVDVLLCSGLEVLSGVVIVNGLLLWCVVMNSILLSCLSSFVLCGCLNIRWLLVVK